MMYISMSILILTIISFSIGLGIIWQGWRYRAKQKDILDVVANEAEMLLTNLQTSNADFASGDTSAMLQSPAYLTTLITVLINKIGGSVRLTETDFLNVTNDEFVSVFVDVDDASLLLCLDSLSAFMTSAQDDSTYN